MIKKYKDYILFAIFIIFIFVTNINTFFDNKKSILNVDSIASKHYIELEKEYNELLSYNDIKKNSKFNLILSKIKYRNLYDFSKNFIIYKGFNDKIEIGDAALDQNGLVGIIKKTYQNTSVVELLTSENTNISVQINKSFGILKCMNNKIVVSEISNYDDINEGDEIITSGLGNITKGIPIGKVSKIEINKSEIEKLITVDLYANIDNINYVLIYEGSHA